MSPPEALYGILRILSRLDRSHLGPDDSDACEQVVETVYATLTPLFKQWFLDLVRSATGKPLDESVHAILHDSFASENPVYAAYQALDSHVQVAVSNYLRARNPNPTGFIDLTMPVPQSRLDALDIPLNVLEHFEALQRIEQRIRL